MGISVKMSLNYITFPLISFLFFSFFFCWETPLISLNFEENENLKFLGEEYMFSSTYKLPNFPFPFAKTPKSKQREWK